MSPFAGVSVVADGKFITTSAVDAGGDSGYHLLVVQGYSRTKEEIPTGLGIISDPFMVGGHEWCIEYCPNGGNSSCADFISLYLYLVNYEEDQLLTVEAQFEFTFVDHVEEQTPVYIHATKICSFSTEVGACWSHGEFVRRDALERSSNLRGDCFTIRCDIMVCKEHNTKDVGGTMSDICQHFNNLLQNEVGADVTYEVSGETFPAHRCVLAARSTVFMAQLFGPMKEGTTSSVIKIEDMEAKVFRALLSFIYTGSFFVMGNDNAEIEEKEIEEQQVEDVIWLQDLFVAADRYDLQRLKLLCEDHLSEEIGVSSVASTLALAEQHYCHRLKEACFKFIQVQSPSCLQKIMATEGWEYVKTTYPSLMNEVTIKLASKT